MSLNNISPAAGVFLLFLVSCLYISCGNHAARPAAPEERHTAAKGSYAYDMAFLKQYTGEALQLGNGAAKVLLSEKYQGRVMTSTATGDNGPGFGWLNYDLIASGQKRKQFNPVGGEERFWMGPEGGQYAIYFNKGDSFNIRHWQVPAFIDTLPYRLVKADTFSATFHAAALVRNYSGTDFSLDIERTIQLLTTDQLQQVLHTVIPPDVHFVAYETINTITNKGVQAWTRDKGLLSVWLLGMFTPGPGTKVIIPFRPRPGAMKYITTDYFGSIPADRLQITDSMLFFNCDGRYRSKVGLSPLIARPVAGAWDAGKNMLTIIVPQVSRDSAYVNSKWEKQREPYRGDVINAYNDGPLSDGTQMGPFFEIESSSPAMALIPGGQGMYRQVTCHFQGPAAALQRLSLQLLGVDPRNIKK